MESELTSTEGVDQSVSKRAGVRRWESVTRSNSHHYELLNAAVVLESLMAAKSVESPDFRAGCDSLQAGFDLHVDFYSLIQPRGIALLQTGRLRIRWSELTG